MDNQIVGVVLSGIDKYMEVIDGVFSVISKKITLFIKKDNPEISNHDYNNVFVNAFSWPILKIIDLSLFKTQKKVESYILFKFNYVTLEIKVIFQDFIPHKNLDGKENFMISIDTDPSDHNFLPENLKDDLIKECLFNLSNLCDTYYSPDGTSELKKFIRE
jgi:hypothetical protein